MSKFTKCNYCRLKQIEADAKSSGLKVTVVPNNQRGGIDVFEHPFDLEIIQFIENQKIDSVEKDNYFVAWFMELPTSCVC